MDRLHGPLGALLLARGRMLRSLLRAEHHGWLRLVVFSLLGLLFAGAIFAASYWFFGKCLEVEPIGEVVVRRILGMSLMVVFSLLSFSNLIGAFSSFYLADDLQLLMPRPVPPYSLYTARYLDTSLDASWMIVPFSSPIFIAAGLLFHAGPAYYLTLAGVLLSFVIIPTSIGVLLSLLLTSVLSARRARHLLVLAGTATLAVLLFLVRQLQPEQLIHSGRRTSLLEVIQTLRGTDPPWLPSTWASDALWPHLGYGIGSDLHPMLLLLATSAMSFFACGWVFRLLHARAFSRAQEGLETGLAARHAKARHSLAALVRRGARGWLRPALAPSLLRKDRLVFFRDTAQWSQLLILAAIVAIYVLNFKYIRVITGTGLISDLGLFFLNLALSGFVSVALAARFVYPAVSLEGPAFWLVRSAPISILSFLHAKARVWAYGISFFANLLLLTTHLFLGTETALAVASVVVITPLVDGLVGLGIGLGARFPRFDTDNAAKIATGLGGVLYMITGATLLTVVVLASIAPTVVASRWFALGRPPGPRNLVIAIVGLLLVVAVPVITGRTAMRIGARHLDRE